MKTNREMIYTIGYQGLTIEEFLNILTENDVNVLCDLRHSTSSRWKPDFSKKRLADRLAQLEIKYIHIPQLGIESARRKNVSSDEDLAKLFEEYSAELPRHKQELQELKTLHNQHHKIALTCLERDPQQCHRTYVSDYLNATHGIEIRHLPED